MKSKIYGEDVILNTKQKDTESKFFFCCELHMDGQSELLFFNEEEVGSARLRAIANKEDFDQLKKDSIWTRIKGWF